MAIHRLPTPEELVDALAAVRRAAASMAVSGHTRPEEVWQEGFLTAAALWQHYPGSARALAGELGRRASAATDMPREIYERSMAAHAQKIMAATGVWAAEDVPEGEHEEPVPEV